MTTATANPSEHAGQSRRSVSMARAMAVAAGVNGSIGLASPKLRTLICPFCGELTADSGKCQRCSARFDPLSRQASQNEMGPWFVRDASMPHRPGCNYSTITRLVESGGIQANSVLRGPSTRQFWMLAKHTPGVAQLLGVCHNCGESVEPGAFACSGCHEPFSADRDRQHLGLGPSRPLPGRARVEVLALHAEPAAGADQVAGPAVYPVSGEDVGDEGGGGEDRRSGSIRRNQQRSEDLDVIKQVDELGRAVRSLRRAWRAERKRAWVSVGCAGLVCAVALVIILVS